MRIGVVGGGMVGQATARSYLEWGDVRVFDTLPERRTHSLPTTLESDVVFVCLPTPQREDGCGADLAFIESFFESVRGNLANFVLKSTVPIGTTKRLRHKYVLPNLIHSPEFLTARCSITDAHMPARNIIGGYGDCKEWLTALYLTRFPGVPIHHMSSDESEAVKLMQNAFFAVKIAFWNEMRTLADAKQMDWDRVLAAVLADGRIAHSHTRVPGHDGRAGFGGNCLPKDLNSLIDVFGVNGLTPHICAAAELRNKMDRQRATDGS